MNEWIDVDWVLLLLYRHCVVVYSLFELEVVHLFMYITYVFYNHYFWRI